MSNHILADRRYILLQRLTGSVGQGGQNSRTDGILVQQLLNRLIARRFLPKYGSPVVTDGNVMGSGYTLMLIEHFQEQFGLPKGPIQPDSAAFSKLLELGTSPMIPAGMPDKKALNFDLAVAYIEKFGTQPAINALYSRNGTRVILGLRARTNTMTKNGGGEYDDLLVVLWMTSRLEKQIRIFDANTEPSAQYDQLLQGKTVDRFGKIANRDFSEGQAAYNNQGINELGCLCDGTYRYKLLPNHPKFGRVLVPTDTATVDRDGNHNGKFGDDFGPLANHSKMSAGYTMLFHKGSSTNTGSAGCQTIPPNQFNEFWNVISNQKEFQYILVTVQGYK